MGHKTFAEHFVVIIVLTGRFLGLLFMRHNSMVNDTTHGLNQFPHVTMQVENTASETSAKLQFVLTGDTLNVPTMTTKPITAFVDQPSELNTTGTVTPLVKFTETASLLISRSMSVIIDKKVAIRVTNTKKSLCLVKKNPNCRVLHSFYGASQVDQISGHGNPQHYSGK